MDFADTVEFIEARYNEIGLIRGIEDSWLAHDTDTGDYLGVITQEGLEYLRSVGITTYGRSA